MYQTCMYPIITSYTLNITILFVDYTLIKLKREEKEMTLGPHQALYSVSVSRDEAKHDAG